MLNCSVQVKEINIAAIHVIMNPSPFRNNPTDFLLYYLLAHYLGVVRPAIIKKIAGTYCNYYAP